MSDKLTFILEQTDNEGYVYNSVTKSCEDSTVDWYSAAESFVHFLRGCGYIINAKDFADCIGGKMLDIAEAEASVSVPEQLSLPLDEE